jgi:hypothetical protein
VVVADGLFSPPVNGALPAHFQKLAAPSDDEVDAVAHKVARKVLALVEKRTPAHGMGEETPSVMSAAYQRAIQGEPEGIDFDHGARPDKRSRRAAIVDGFSVHANRIVAKRDRDGLERLCRYGARPILSLERLSQTAAGHVTYPRKYPSRLGQTMLEMEPPDFLERLATLIPPMRSHLVRYAGVFAPHSKLRPAVVLERMAPGAAAANTTDDTSIEVGCPLAWGSRVPWAALLKKVFEIDVLVCKECGGKMRIIAFLNDAEVTRTILTYLHMPSAPPRKWPARAPPEILSDQEPRLEVEQSSDDPAPGDWFPDPEPDYNLD